MIFYCIIELYFSVFFQTSELVGILVWLFLYSLQGFLIDSGKDLSFIFLDGSFYYLYKNSHVSSIELTVFVPMKMQPSSL